MSLVTVRECPRKAFAQSALPRTSKSSSLRSVMRETLRLLNYDPLSCSKADVRKACKDAFDAKAEKMLDFEAAAECSRLTFLIERWVLWEQQHADWKLIEKEFTETVTFAGVKHEVHIDALVKRVDHVEAIQFHYSSPKMNMNGRVVTTMPDKNPELLLLELAGEQAAKRHGFRYGGSHPIYASFFHMKGKLDSAKQMELEFDKAPGANIISYYFSPVERHNLEAEFKVKTVSAKDACCDPSSCRECVCNDLCYAEFVPHKLEDAPDVELNGRDTSHPVSYRRRR